MWREVGARHRLHELRPMRFKTRPRDFQSCVASLIRSPFVAHPATIETAQNRRLHRMLDDTS